MLLYEGEGVETKKLHRQGSAQCVYCARTISRCHCLPACSSYILLHAGYAFCLEGGGKDRIAAEERGGLFPRIRGRAKRSSKVHHPPSLACLAGPLSSSSPPLLFPRKKAAPRRRPPPLLLLRSSVQSSGIHAGRRTDGKAKIPHQEKKVIGCGAAERDEANALDLFATYYPLFSPPSPLPVWRFCNVGIYPCDYTSNFFLQSV